MPELEERVLEIQSKVETLILLRQEDRNGSAKLEERISHSLSEISGQISKLRSELSETSHSLQKRLESLEGSVGVPTKKTSRRYENVWAVLETPFYKQPVFLVGLATLPGILLAGFVLGELDFPKLSYWSHKLLGTHEAVVTAFEQDSDMSEAADHVVASATSDPTSEVRTALNGWLDDSETLAQAVRDELSREIISQFTTISMSQLSVGVANYRPELFAGKDAISRSQVKVDENVIPVPSRVSVDIYVTVFAQRFDLALIDASHDPALLSILDVNQQREVNERIRPYSVFYLREMPSLSVNGQKLALEPVPPPDGTMIDENTPLPMLTTHTFKATGFETPGPNRTIGATVLRVGLSASDVDTGDTEWKYLVTINRTED